MGINTAVKNVLGKLNVIENGHNGIGMPKFKNPS